MKRRPLTPRRSPPPKSSARGAALEVLGQVLGHKQPLDTALADNKRNGNLNHLDPRDRAFARTLAATVLRRLLQIDRVIATLVERPIPPNHSPVQDVLRLGAAQILFLGTPSHAAVDNTVSLVPRRSARFRGLVNAVLRRLAKDGVALVADDDAPRINTPDWLWHSWTAAYGADATRTIAEIHLEAPPLDFTVKDPARTEDLAQALDAQVLPTGTLRRRAGGVITGLPGYGVGDWWIQDAAAALPVRVLISAAQNRKDDPARLSAIDLCAAPGGKTAQLAAAGVHVTAVDRSNSRLRLLERNLARLGLNAKTVAADVTLWRPAVPADLVLLDAPCSATGTLRRHPDIPHLRSPDDVAAMAQTQAALLKAAAEMVVPGGFLVYVVCSLQPEEGPQVVAEFLGANPDFIRVPITGLEIGGLDPCVTPDGDLRTLPCHLSSEGGQGGGMDGFYAARLTRIK